MPGFPALALHNEIGHLSLLFPFYLPATLGLPQSLDGLRFNHSVQEGHEHLSRRQLTPLDQNACLRAYHRALALVTLRQVKVPFESLARLGVLEYLTDEESRYAADPDAEVAR